MNCDDCDGRGRVFHRTVNDEWVCDGCALALWMENPAELTGQQAIFEDELAPKAIVMRNLARTRKAKELVRAVRAAGLAARAPSWDRIAWMAFCDTDAYPGDRPPSPETIAYALIALARPEQLEMVA